MKQLELVEQEGVVKQTAVLSGLLAAIEQGSGRFQLALDDKRVVRGFINVEHLSVEHVGCYLASRITSKGLLAFDRSGEPVFFEAHAMRPALEGESIFSRIPVFHLGKKRESDFTREGVSDFEKVRGQWPGDESIEQILEALRKNG